MTKFIALATSKKRNVDDPRLKYSFDKNLIFGHVQSILSI